MEVESKNATYKNIDEKDKFPVLRADKTAAPTGSLPVNKAGKLRAPE